MSLESLVTWIGIEMSKSEEVLIGALKRTYTSSSEHNLLKQSQSCETRLSEVM